jgi:hypothetical protein
MIISDAPSCGVTWDQHSDESRGIIYDRNMFIVRATDRALTIKHFLEVKE